MNTSNMQETTIKPNPDQIQEIKVLQNNYSAVNNIMGANAVIVLTKSGTSELQGGGWEFYRNTNFDANNYFSTTKPLEDQNLYGFDLGGPVVLPHLYHGRDKTFFYVNLQWVNLAEAMVFNGTTPTAAMRGVDMNINWYTSSAFANWDAFEVNVRHPMGHGLFISGAYTWSHNLSMLSGQQFGITGSTPQNSNNPTADYGNSTLDTPNALGGSLIYKAPWGEHARPLKRALLAGWKFSDITTIQSGKAITPGLSTSNNGLANRPDNVGAISYPKQITQWFTSSAFAKPADGFFGNASPGLLHGPGLIVFDAAVGKETHVTDRVNIQWRMGFFNVLNHPNFGNPGASYGSNTFGKISSAKDPRLGEMVFKVLF